MRTNLSLHGITAADFTAKSHRDGLYVDTGGHVAFDVGSVSLFFDGPAEFAAWLAALNALAANTPCVAEAMNPEPEFAATEVPADALADYERYCDQLATFTPDATPASLAAWWARYADNYEAVEPAMTPMPMGGPYCDAETTTEHDSVFICTRPAGHGGAHAAHITPDMPPVHVWAAAAPVEPGSFSLCLEESGGYLCTRPVGHEDEHIASGVHGEHVHGGSVRWPQ